tara:strand:- start:51 stop:323 length:273 start_codon:yes stop_codon:yes gene_type:complete
MLKETIFALMLVTSDGAWEIAEFDTLDACKEAKAEVTQQDTFCYKRDPISQEAQLNIAIDTFILFLEKFQASIKQYEEYDLRQDQAVSIE